MVICTFIYSLIHPFIYIFIHLSYIVSQLNLIPSRSLISYVCQNIPKYEPPACLFFVLFLHTYLPPIQFISSFVSVYSFAILGMCSYILFRSKTLTDDVHEGTRYIYGFASNFKFFNSIYYLSIHLFIFKFLSLFFYVMCLCLYC